MEKHTSLIYDDWKYITYMYFLLLDKSESTYEVVIPLIVSLVCSTIYARHALLTKALIHISNIMPSIASILIGFTVMLITILLTSGSSTIDVLKERLSEKKLYGNKVSLYQLLHIQFCHLLIIEVFLLLLILAYLFLSEIGMSVIFQFSFLALICFITLSILLCIVRSISNLHFAFFNSKIEQRN